MDIKAIVNGREFKASIDDSEAGRAFMELLPLRFEMEEMNGNEKCRYLSRKLPTAPEAVGSIESGDIMLFGFDDLPLASCLECPLSSVRQPRREIGFEAAKLLCEEIDGKLSQPVTKVLPVELMERNSSRNCLER